MSKLYFCNESVFDVESALIFGVSAKEGDNNIGKFGTGFKYAVAMILKDGGSITVHTLEKRFVFGVVEEEFRGKTQQYVTVNGEKTTFVTNLGLSWEDWMAYRELRCNCQDEGGEIVYELDEFHEWGTVIEVDSEIIHAAHSNQDLYFLNSKPKYQTDVCEFHIPANMREKGRFYYQGVLVSRSDTKVPFDINFKCKVDLTEERTLKYDNWEKMQAFNSVAKSNDEGLIYSCVSSDMYLQEGCTLSETFYKVACRVESAGNLNINLSERLRDYRKDKALFEEFTPTKVQQSMLDRAFKFLSERGVSKDDFPVKCVKGMGSGVMGLAKDGVIYLSEIPFNQGTKQVACTIFEEWVHNKFGCKDFDREMQNYLFETIMSMLEELNGEAM